MAFGALVEEQLDPLAGGLLAARVLLVHGSLRASVSDLGDATLEVGQLAGGGVEIHWIAVHIDGGGHRGVSLRVRHA